MFPKDQYKALKQRHIELRQEQDKIFQAVNAEGREFTEAERQRDDAIVAELATVNADLARHERRRELEKTGPGVPLVNGVRDLIEDDPKRGFANFGEFALAVKSAYSPNGRQDERLNYLAATPSSTNTHYETGTDEGRMVPPAFREAIVEAITQGDDSLLNVVDAEPTNSNAVEFLRDESTPWGATGVQAAWRSEGAQMTPSKLATAGEQVRLHELYAFVQATGEMLQDAARLTERLTRKSGLAIRYKINEAIVNGTGAGQPLGWFTSAAKVTQTKEGSQAATTLVAGNVAKMYARNLNPGRAVWYVNQDTLPQMFTMTLGNAPIWTPPASGFVGAPGGFLFGRPVIPLENCATLGTVGDVQFVDPKGYYAATKGTAPEFAESMHLLFDYNVTAFRWVFRFGGQPYLSAAITPAKGSTTRAHVVVLETRS